MVPSQEGYGVDLSPFIGVKVIGAVRLFRVERWVFEKRSCDDVREGQRDNGRLAVQ